MERGGTGLVGSGPIACWVRQCNCSNQTADKHSTAFKGTRPAQIRMRCLKERGRGRQWDVDSTLTLPPPKRHPPPPQTPAHLSAITISGGSTAPPPMHHPTTHPPYATPAPHHHLPGSSTSPASLHLFSCIYFSCIILLAELAESASL